MRRNTLKNSVETKAGFGLSSIDEHRLSLGLLAMLLLAGVGYGIWIAVSPLLPFIAAKENPGSRNRNGDSHLGKSEWPEAISIYRKILEDDPDNGYVILKIAVANDNQLTEKWEEYEKLASNTVDSKKVNLVLDQENQLFQSAFESWSGLLDNARYRRRAFERLACLHSLRSKKLNHPEDADKAIAMLDEMLKRGCTTYRGMNQTQDLTPLRDHRQFSRLVREETRIKNL